MTAGHCFAEDNPNNWNIEIEDFTLAFGVDDIADLEDAIKLQFLPIQTRKITKKSLHPYKTYNYPRAYNDVLVIEVSPKVDLGPQTWPLCLPDAPNTNANHLMGDFAELIGYGPETDDSTDLNLITKRIEDRLTCDFLYNPDNVGFDKRDRVLADLPNDFNDTSVICASVSSSTAKGTCPGDSGAPLMKKTRKIRDGKLVSETTLIAVLHGGLIRCDNSVFPGIYTRITVPHIWNWLMNKFINKVEEEKGNYQIHGAGGVKYDKKC